MNEAMTWNDYFTYKLIVAVASVFLSALLSWMFHVSNLRYCPHCSRRKQWRWKKPHELASRSYCPYHDEWENFK